MTSAREALSLLREGNCQFGANHSTAAAISNKARREARVSEQEPVTIILATRFARARELVFDKGFVDLFVIRTAGNKVEGAPHECNDL